MPVEPEASAWQFPPAGSAEGDELVGVGADLEPGTMLAAYRQGIFPMPLSRPRRGREGPLGWWSPDPRGIIPVGGLHVSRSLRRARSRFRVSVDTAFAEVVTACADPSRPHGWISPRMRRGYLRLHELGWAHSVEVWTPDGQLAGGVFGIATGGLFAGESMFHRVRDASKVALVVLVELLADMNTAGACRGTDGRLLDVQWTTAHLCSLGAVQVSRADYLARLDAALALPLPSVFAPSPRRRTR